MSENDDCADATPGALVSIGGEIVPPVNIPGVGLVQELLCDDDGPDSPHEPGDPDHPECKCATKRLCPHEDANGDSITWWELCLHNGLCKWRPLLDKLFETLSPTQAAAVCAWIVENCGQAIWDWITNLASFPTTVVGAIKSQLFEAVPFDGSAGEPPCDSSGACVKFLRDTSTADDDCPDGYVTHICVGGQLLCVGGGSGGGPGGGDDPAVTVDAAAAAYGPTLTTPVEDSCGPNGEQYPMGTPNSVTGTFCQSDVDATQYSAGALNGTFNHHQYHDVIVTNGPGSVTITMDVSGNSPAGVAFWDSAGNVILPSSVAITSGTINNNQVHAGGYNCPGGTDPGVTWFGIGGGTETVTLVYPALATGTYTMVIKGSDCVSDIAATIV